MPKKKRSVKKSTASAPKKLHHHQHKGHKDFMLVLMGGFVVIVFIFLLSGSFKPTVSTYTNTEASMMEEQQETVVTIKEFSYDQETVTVKKGTTVTWTNDDSDEHSATADDGSFDTGLLGMGESGSVTFAEVGTYTYHCSTHPNMTGTVVVVE